MLLVRIVTTDLSVSMADTLHLALRWAPDAARPIYSAVADGCHLIEAEQRKQETSAVSGVV